MGLRTLELDDPEWDSIIDSANAPIFYTREYCRFRFDPAESRSILFHFTNDKGSVFDVSVAKDVRSLSFFSRVSANLTIRPIDLSSPEYNGPILLCEDAQRADLLAAYRESLLDFCDRNSVVTEFVRFHPLIGIGSELGAKAASSVVYVDLRQGYEKARQLYRKSHKWRINKAQRNGAHSRFVDPTESAVHNLAVLYEQTMRCREAKSIDYRSEDFFHRFFRTFSGKAFLLEAYIGDALVSSSTFLRSAKELWYMYSGSAVDQLRTGAHTFAMDQVIRWAASEDLEYVILGGGVTPEDGVFEFKTGFSHSLAQTLHLKRVHNSTLLNKLCEAKARYNQERGTPVRGDYFPSYWLD